jgi:purine-binding chemotaxis protein CheW
MIEGYVLFTLAEQKFALSLADVREIVRLGGLERLPGTRPPLAGIIVLRGNPLPILDVRPAGAASDAGDVLVMDFAGDPVGIAVDGVISVVPDSALPEAEEPPAKTLPGYVVGIRRSASGPVMLVDLERLLDAAAAGWTEALTSPIARSCIPGWPPLGSAQT